jgi:esterase/lipase superfamily enzyme
MELLVFGYSGARVLVFPTSKGKFYEWEDRGMVAALAEPLERGWFQLYCVDSVDAESWYARWAHPGGRAIRHIQYENYLLHEVLPLSWGRNLSPYLITTGASFGAYHAMNFGLRHPDFTNRILALSGIYSVDMWTDGYSDDNIYFNNPMAYVAHEHDAGRLHRLKQVDIIMTAGRDDPNIEHNRQFSSILWSKDIWHAFREWDGWAHDWPWWQKMFTMYVGGHD